ncbi:Flavin-containing monooxygenase FMO GS-OX3 [Dendrobium catenatum]|uniref:Flavin-containing monooxygenase n=1 Tax=Dendrobium catenatum TaxID=906689 RepID=A0A2I0XBY1_9ASPA|nr:Flavin-containing monooxygenase FMO GS-OX3 [Dendrobium catenatum]
MTANRRVAVIGAGASGLSAARALRQEGHSVAVFERSAGIGGTWIYSTAVESDHLSADPNRKIVHSSLYDSLRTNLPRESMGFFDYPFVAVPGEEDCRRFAGHREVLRYLEDFASESGLYDLIRFGVEVVRVEMEGEGRWSVVSRSVVGGGGGGDDENEVFDGVVVCVGHYTEPRVAEIPGIFLFSNSAGNKKNNAISPPIFDNWQREYNFGPSIYHALKVDSFSHSPYKKKSYITSIPYLLLIDVKHLQMLGIVR